MHPNSLANLKKGKAFGSHVEGAPNPTEAQEKSTKVQAARRTLKEELLLMLSEPEVQKKVCTALINEAINGNNSRSVRAAFETIMKAIGEEPDTKVALDGVKFTFGNMDGDDYSG